jgi:hypothetical protein
MLNSTNSSASNGAPGPPGQYQLGTGVQVPTPGAMAGVHLRKIASEPVRSESGAETGHPRGALRDGA